MTGDGPRLSPQHRDLAGRKRRTAAHGVRRTWRRRDVCGVQPKARRNRLARWDGARLGREIDSARLDPLCRLRLAAGHDGRRSECPLSTTGSRGLATSQIWAVPSSEAVTSRLPSPLNATLVIESPENATEVTGDLRGLLGRRNTDPDRLLGQDGADLGRGERAPDRDPEGASAVALGGVVDMQERPPAASVANHGDAPAAELIEDRSIEQPGARSVEELRSAEPRLRAQSRASTAPHCSDQSIGRSVRRLMQNPRGSRHEPRSSAGMAFSPA